MAKTRNLPGLWAGLIVVALLACAAESRAAEKLIWLLRDLAPLTVFDGPKKGQGMIDQLMPALIASMPSYEHVVLRVNKARAIQMLKDQPLACDPTLIWSSARAHSIIYSTPITGLHSNGLAIRRENQPLLEPFVHDQELDLLALLNTKTVKLGVIAQRSYGEWIDEQVSHGPQQQLFKHYGSDPLGSLLQMQRVGRVQAVLGYWPEIQSKADQVGLPKDALIFYPVKGAPKYQLIYIGCSDTEQGREAIHTINAVLANLGDNVLNTLKAQWAIPDHTEEYQESGSVVPSVIER
ncbi:TIGR02285 family protein [Pseudomonas sp. TMW22091]|uniref:TIGR02285 family protein n=1 Tax=Pseudomonas sp. TMW22091 TaxID=2506435 RepID=UPI001F1014BF|nr:TIGR02285 family protein [Pseudomonas sp. TMW22091]MCH4874178.1 TIGR02285 family protein [Pseudomonas sp. TMW22091]